MLTIYWIAALRSFYRKNGLIPCKTTNNRWLTKKLHCRCIFIQAILRPVRVRCFLTFSVDSCLCILILFQNFYLSKLSPIFVLCRSCLASIHDRSVYVLSSGIKTIPYNNSYCIRNIYFSRLLLLVEKVLQVGK